MSGPHSLLVHLTVRLGHNDQWSCRSRFGPSFSNNPSCSRREQDGESGAKRRSQTLEQETNIKGDEERHKNPARITRAHITTMNPQEQPRPHNGGGSTTSSSSASQTTSSASSSSKAGIFVDRSGSKPLPLSGTRFVVPHLPHLFKKTGTGSSKATSATILRRAGDGSAFSEASAELSGDEDIVVDAWVCSHCSSKNHTRSKGICTICKQVTANPQPMTSEDHRPIARRARRPGRDGPEQQQGTSSSATPRLRGYGEGSSRSWSPPPSHQRRPQQPQQPRRVSLPQVDSSMAPPPSLPNHARSPSPGVVVVPTNPFQQQAAPESELSRTVPRTTSFDSAASSGSRDVVPVVSPTPPHHSTTTLPPSTHSRSHRSASPAFSTTTSVDTPIRSNMSHRHHDPFAPPPYQSSTQARPPNMLRPIQSATAASTPSGKFPHPNHQALTRPKFGQDWEGGTLV